MEMENRTGVPPYSYVYDHEIWQGTESPPVGQNDRNPRSNATSGTAANSVKSGTSNVYEYINDDTSYQGLTTTDHTYTHLEKQSRMMQEQQKERASRFPHRCCLTTAVIIFIVIVMGLTVFLVIHFTGLIYPGMFFNCLILILEM